MRSLRTLAALAFALLGLAVGVPSASAIDPFPVTRHMTLSNANFTVHYHGDAGHATCTTSITEEHAGDLLGMLDRARTFSANMGLGLPSPLPGAGGRVNVSIDGFGAGCLEIPAAIPLPPERWDAFVTQLGGGVDDI